MAEGNGGPPHLLTLLEAARALRLAESHVRALVRAGALPVIRFHQGKGARLYFDAADLTAFVGRHKTRDGAP